MARNKETSPRPFLKGAAMIAALGMGAFSLSGCAPTEAKPVPPASAPANPGEPTPSPVETATNKEKDPLSPEVLWAMSDEELLEAVRIPEGTSPEEYPIERSRRREALLNAAASQEAYKDWQADDAKNGVTLDDCSNFVYSKIERAMELLDGGPLNRKGPANWALLRACYMNSVAKAVPYLNDYLPKITEKVEVISVSGKDVKFKYVITDNVTGQYVDDCDYYKIGTNLLKVDDGGYILNVGGTVEAIGVGYNADNKTVQPTERRYPKSS